MEKKGRGGKGKKRSPECAAAKWGRIEGARNQRQVGWRPNQGKKNTSPTKGRAQMPHTAHFPNTKGRRKRRQGAAKEESQRKQA